MFKDSLPHKKTGADVEKISLELIEHEREKEYITLMQLGYSVSPKSITLAGKKGLERVFKSLLRVHINRFLAGAAETGQVKIFEFAMENKIDFDVDTIVITAVMHKNLGLVNWFYDNKVYIHPHSFVPAIENNDELMIRTLIKMNIIFPDIAHEALAKHGTVETIAICGNAELIRGGYSYSSAGARGTDIVSLLIKYGFV